MSTKNIAILVLWIIGIALLAFVGFDIVSTTKYNLVAVALMAWLIGVTLDKFWAVP